MIEQRYQKGATKDPQQQEGVAEFSIDDLKENHSFKIVVWGDKHLRDKIIKLLNKHEQQLQNAHNLWNNQTPTMQEALKEIICEA